MNESITITWRAFEHHHRHHSSDWYWALGIVTVSTALIALLLSDVLFSVVILVAGVAVGLVAGRPPTEMDFAINERGVAAHHEFFPFADIRAFWIADDQFGEPHLYVDTPRIMTPDVIIPIPEKYQDDIRELLRVANIPEQEMSEPLPHRLLEFFGF